MIDIDMKVCSPAKIFKFDKRDIVFDLMYKKNMDSKFKQAFRYLIEKIKPQKFEADLSKMEWEKGKNYHWISIQEGNVTLMIRKYQFHFTIFFRILKKKNLTNVVLDVSKYGCFIFHTDRNKMSDEESDSIYENHYLDINESLSPLMKYLDEHGSQALWNDHCFPRLKRVEIKNVWDGSKDHISSIDDFAYCCEELFEKYLEHFAKNDMLEKIKTFKVGDMLSSYRITSISTEVKDEYYHGVGLELQNTNFPDDKPSWSDVYSLTRYYYEYIFGEDQNDKDEDN